MSILLLTIGGGIGAILRYMLGIYIMSVWKCNTLPVAMVIVNVIGSFGLGSFLGVHSQLPYEDPLYLLFAIGLFGAFTTFSTFSMEARELLYKKRYKELILYLMMSIAGSIILFIVGFLLTSTIR